jgi:putative ABC transport system substrate-binding protein
VIGRRAFLAAAGAVLLATPFAAEAQQTGKVPRVGYLLPSTLRPSNEEFLVGLRSLGYIDGKNILIERRYADGGPERYSELAADLVRLPVDVIVADGSAATRSAKRATTTIPIVMVSADPVGLGFITSLAKPGGNITGLSTNSTELSGKRLQLVREVFPHVSKLAILFNALNPASPSFVKELELAAQALRLKTERVSVRNAAELESVFAILANKRHDPILIVEDPTLLSVEIGRIAQLAVKYRLPTVVSLSEHARTGTLMSYGPSFAHMFQRTAFYVDKILKGAKPGDLPVEQPTKFELLINLKTAKALGLTIPPSLLGRADEVIQ